MKVVRTKEQVWKVNDEICITHFLSLTRQLFETKEGSFVYLLDEDKLYKLELEKYTRLLIKLVCFQDNLIHRDNTNVYDSTL